MNVSVLGHVDTEGGPLLLGDLELVRDWHGIEQGAADYDRACAFFDANPGAEGGELPTGAGNVLLWEMSGAGTAFVLELAEDELLIVRPWFHEHRPTDAVIRDLATAPANVVVEIGDVRVRSGFIAITWSTEDGGEIAMHPRIRGGHVTRAVRDESGAIIARMPVGTYSARHETTTSSVGSARRLRVIRHA